MAQARFIARYGAFSVGIRHRIAEHYGTGEARVLQRRLDAQFYNNIVTDEDFAVALQVFRFDGLPEDFDTNELVSPRYRVSVWDSEYAKEYEGHPQEDIDLIIEGLRKDSGNGPDFIELTTAAAEKPWPTYDSLEDVDQIVSITLVTGLDPEKVAVYEEENRNRTAVLDALRASEEADDDAFVVQA